MNRDIIDFKSSSEYFKDECSGLKPNTARIIKIADERFQKLMRAWKNQDYPLIRINKSGYGGVDKLNQATEKEPNRPDSFLRSIKHIAIWNNIMIITWEHNSKGE